MLTSTSSHLYSQCTDSFLDNWSDCLMQRSVATDIWRGARRTVWHWDPSPCVSSTVCVFPSPALLLVVFFFFYHSVCLNQLIIKMSTARSLPSKRVAGMFSIVPVLFAMWNQSPQTWRIRPQFAPHAALLPIKERSTTAENSSQLITARK